MEPIEERLAQYPVLSDEERLAIEAQVASRPDLAPLLEEAQAWHALFREGSLLGREEVTDEAVAYLVASRYMERHPPPPNLERMMSQLERKVRSDPAASRRYDRFVRRLEELERGSDPVTQFEELTGQPLDPPRTRLFFLRRAGRAVAAAVAVLLLIYAALFAVSWAIQPSEYRLAALERDGVADDLRSVRMRGDAAQGDPYEPLRQAAILLHDARTSTLGLFPRYDEDKLNRAASSLEAIAARPGAAPDVQQQANYLLGKARLAQGDRQDARRAFQRVVESRAGPVDEASEMLDRIGPP